MVWIRILVLHVVSGLAEEQVQCTHAPPQPDVGSRQQANHPYPGPLCLNRDWKRAPIGPYIFVGCPSRGTFVGRLSIHCRFLNPLSMRCRCGKQGVSAYEFGYRN